MRRRDRLRDAPRRFDAPIRGAREVLKAVEVDDTRTNGPTTFDEHPLLRRSPRRFVADHRETRLEPFENVSSSPIFSHQEVVVIRVARGERIAEPCPKTAIGCNLSPYNRHLGQNPLLAAIRDAKWLQPFQPVISTVE